MKIKIRIENEVHILEFEGSLDAQTWKTAQAEFDNLIDQGQKKILVNFKNLPYISSLGLRVLLDISKKLKAVNGELRVCDLSSVVKEVFETSGFNSILNVFQSESEALESF